MKKTVAYIALALSILTITGCERGWIWGLFPEDEEEYLCNDESACNYQDNNDPSFFNPSDSPDKGYWENNCLYLYDSELFDCYLNCLPGRDCNWDCGGTAVEDNCGACDSDPDNDCAIDCTGTWGGDATEDNCGVCDSDPDNDCAFDCEGMEGGNAIEDCNGECNGSAYEDCSNTCCGGSTGIECLVYDTNLDCCEPDLIDCNGECNGSAYEDCSNTCCGGGTGTECLEYDSNQDCCEPNLIDCWDVCGGNNTKYIDSGGSICIENPPSGWENQCEFYITEPGNSCENPSTAAYCPIACGLCDLVCDCDGNILDECGVCGGDGPTECGDGSAECNPASCPDQPEGDFTLSFGAAIDNTVEILMTNSLPVAGFQFSVSGITLLDNSGGLAEDNGLNISVSATTVIGFSITGDTIPAGDGVLLNLGFSGYGEACLTDVILTNSESESYNVEVGGCFTYDPGYCWNYDNNQTESSYSNASDCTDNGFIWFSDDSSCDTQTPSTMTGNITSPDGETYSPEGWVNLLWNIPQTSNEVNIYLYHENYEVDRMASFTPDDGQFSHYLPANLPSSDCYHYVITLSSNTNSYIVGPYFTIE